MLSRVNAYEWYEYVCSGIVKVRDQITIRLDKIHNFPLGGGRGYCQSVGERLRALKNYFFTGRSFGEDAQGDPLHSAGYSPERLRLLGQLDGNRVLHLAAGSG